MSVYLESEVKALEISTNLYFFLLTIISFLLSNLLLSALKHLCAIVMRRLFLKPIIASVNFLHFLKLSRI
jgi:hypothetical protein